VSAPEPTYEKCAHCHLFVTPNDEADRYPEMGFAEWDHLHRGDAADEALDASHEPTPSGEVHALAWWREHGPAAMRARFDDA